jgi:hypothetical protein
MIEGWNRARLAREEDPELPERDKIIFPIASNEYRIGRYHINQTVATKIVSLSYPTKS